MIAVGRGSGSRAGGNDARRVKVRRCSCRVVFTRPASTRRGTGGSGRASRARRSLPRRAATAGSGTPLPRRKGAKDSSGNTPGAADQKATSSEKSSGSSSGSPATSSSARGRGGAAGGGGKVTGAAVGGGPDRVVVGDEFSSTGTANTASVDGRSHGGKTALDAPTIRGQRARSQRTVRLRATGHQAEVTTPNQVTATGEKSSQPGRSHHRAAMRSPVTNWAQADSNSSREGSTSAAVITGEDGGETGRTAGGAAAAAAGAAGEGT